jgi:hypothetical protein
MAMAHEIRACDALKNPIVGRDVVHSLFPPLLCRILRGLLIMFRTVLVSMVIIILITVGISILRLSVREARLFPLRTSQYCLLV